MNRILMTITALLSLLFLFLCIDTHLNRRPLPGEGLQLCQMSFMHPVFHPVHIQNHSASPYHAFHAKYALYLYREGGYSPAASNLDSLDVVLGGTPVLFIPGNRGSYKQARSIASHGAQLFRMIKTGGGVGEDREEGRQWNSQWWVSQAAASLDFFAVDLNEELAGLHGGTLLEQADYVNEVIRFLLKEYYPSRATGMSSSFTTMPTAVILIGHSMGGFVARTALTRPNYVNGTIHTILTLATPHQAPAAPLDYELTRAYQQVNAFWYHSFYGGGGHHEQSAYNPLGHISLLSISGGDLDKMVPARLSVVDSIVPGTHAMTVFTTDIPFVWTAADHQCIVWCKQVVDVVSRILVKTVDVSVGHRVIGLRERMKVFSDYLKGNTSMDAKLGGSTYLWSVPVSSKIVQFRSPFVILQGKSLAKTHVISVTDQVFDVMENGLVLISNVPCTVRACRPVVGSDTHDCQTMEINYDPVPTSDRSQPAYWRTLLTKKHLDSWTLLFIEQSSIQYNVESAFLSIRDYKKSRDTVQLYAPSIWNWKSQTRIESKTLSKINIMNPQQTLLMLRISFEFNQDCIRESENSPKFQSTVYIYDRLINEGKYRPARSISVLLRGLLTDVSSYQGHQSVDPDDAATTLSLFYNPNCQLDYITVEIDYIGTLSAVFQRFRTAVVLLLFVMAIWIFRSQVMEYTESGRFISFPKALYIHAISEMVPFLACVVVVLFFTDAGIAGWTGIPHSWILLPVFWFWSIGILSVFYSILFVIVRVFSLLAAIIRADVVLRFAHISNYESQKRKRIRQSIILFVLVVMCLTIIPMHFASFVSWTTLLIATVRTSFLHNKLLSLLLLWTLGFLLHIPGLWAWLQNISVKWVSSHDHNLLPVLPALAFAVFFSDRLLPFSSDANRKTKTLTWTFFVLSACCVYALIFGVNYTYELPMVIHTITAWLIVLHLFADEASSSRPYFPSPTLMSKVV